MNRADFSLDNLQIPPGTSNGVGEGDIRPGMRRGAELREDGDGRVGAEVSTV